MTLLHGFINSRLQSEALSKVIEWLSQHQGFDVSTSGMNGEVVYHIFSSRNGSSESWNVLKKRLSFAITQEASDTYGVFFVYDQAQNSGDNWCVWRLASNQLTELEDKYLSPYSQIIDLDENSDSPKQTA